MEIKAIACDVDGTLTNHVAQGDLGAIEMIRYLEAAGLPVILVTGRDYEPAGWLSTYLGACGVVVVEDGAVIADFHSGKPPVVAGDHAEIERGLAVLRQALGDQMRVWDCRGRIFTAALELGAGTSVQQANAALVEHGVRARLVDHGLICVLSDIDVNKGTGLREAAAILGIQTDNIVAIGDNFNDLHMFAVAGYSIAVGNAPEAVKDQVDYACSACFGAGFCEGVRHALERFPVPSVHLPAGGSGMASAG